MKLEPNGNPDLNGRTVEFKALNEKERRERIMATLLDSFQKVVDQFNACSKPGEYRAKLTVLFDPNIIINKVDDLTPPPTSFATRAVVIDYLEREQTTKLPRFHPASTEETASGPGTTAAQVSGLAVYIDKSADLQGSRVRYFFYFTRLDDNSPWLLTNASTANVA